MKKKILLFSVCTAVLVGIQGGVTPAASAEDFGYWSYSDTLPEYVSTPTRFTINFDVDHPEWLEYDGIDPEGAKACSMTFQGQTDDAAPWEFTYDPNYKEYTDSGTWRTDNNLRIKLCNGTEETKHISRQKPYEVVKRFVSSGLANAAIPVTNNTNTPVTVSVLNGDKTLTEMQLPPESDRNLVFSTKNIKATKYLTARFKTDAGDVEDYPIVVTHKWRTIWQGIGGGYILGGINNDGGATFAPCSTVYWTHDFSKKPKDIKTALFERDIRKSFNLLSKYTGLKFVKADANTPSTAPSIHFFWGRAKGAEGLGGPSGNGGTVEISNRSSWVKDRNTGWGSRGRNWLIAHETMHVLGLGHSTDRQDQMYPIHRTQSTMGVGDKAGLRALYPQAMCKA